jgi:hypothetical protein
MVPVASAVRLRGRKAGGRVAAAGRRRAAPAAASLEDMFVLNDAALRMRLAQPAHGPSASPCTRARLGRHLRVKLVIM